MTGEQQRNCQVRVGVRVRPLASKEIQQGGKLSLSINPPASITIASHNTFTFDAVFDSQTDQDTLYHSVSSSLLESFVDGYNATILAYGQTGSGKTYTMGSEAHTQPEGSPQVGLIPRFISDFFRLMQDKRHASNEAAAPSRPSDDGLMFSQSPRAASILLDYHMKASFLEVYGEDVYDLLDSERKSLPLREDSDGGIVIAGLTTRMISNSVEALNVLHEGTNNRTTAATLMNLTSSRSHAVFTITLTQKTRGEDQVDVVSTSKFTFVDLAGSERMKKTGAEGERAREGIKINEGLLALGNVINALADEERLIKEKTIHVPYRQSKLTRLLQDALGGNSQTFFLACVSPSDTNVSETLSTLRYANRARNIRNAPTKNLDATTSELQRLNALTRILQCELIKAKFQGPASENDTALLGTVDESLVKRPDVETYLELIHRTVHEMTGTDKPPSFQFQPLSSYLHPGSNGLPPKAPSKGETIKSAVDATPNKGIAERFDDSFLIDVNPDEDMAILDRLLELQQHDQEYDAVRKRDDDSLREMNGELQKEETLLLQLRESLKAYHSLKKKYEELMAEVQQLEAEKENLASQLEKATADPSMGCSAAIKRQLEKVELSLNRARRETLTHRQKYKEAENQARRCQLLERKIAELKQAKLNLIKKQKESAARYKEVADAKTKELLALKRKEKAADMQLSKMKMEIQHHKSNLEKRRQYCEKLSDKLKQTETHLMKLLSMRQRDLVERASLLGNKGMGPILETLHEYEDACKPSHEMLSNEDLKSIQFISDRMVSEKIDHALLLFQYKERVAEYSETMRQVIVNVKSLQDFKDKQNTNDEDGKVADSVSELKESIAELELKLELLGTEINEMETLMPTEAKQLKEEEAVKKLLSKLPKLALRKLLLDSFSRLVESETERRSNQELIRRKDAALFSLENELEMLNGKVNSLTRDLINRRVMMESGCDLFVALKEAQEKNDSLERDLVTTQGKMENLQQDLSLLNEKYDAQSEELENTKDSLNLAQTSLAKLQGSVESEVTLRELQEIWRVLGVDTETRATIREDIRTCVASTCERHLKEASALKMDTERELFALREKKSQYRSALGLPDQKQITGLGMLEETKLLREQVEILERSYTSANVRREKIVSDMVSLSTALSISKHELPKSLCILMQQIEKASLGNTTIGRLRRASIMENVQVMVESLSNELEGETMTSGSSAVGRQYTELPAGSLEESFLTNCEDDIAELRVRKSEMLVKSREIMRNINSLVRDLHASVSDVIDLIESMLRAKGQEVPVWWDSEEASALVKRVSASSPRSDGEALQMRYLEVIHRVLSAIASSRGSISTTLREIVEKAQQKLLDIVGREVEASEAYASFHDALLKLPFISVDFSYACIAEMEALIAGVEAMTQSEIEALTVVWEALKVSPEERRAFWGRFDNPDNSKNSTDEDLFDKLSKSMEEVTEEWITPLITKGRKVNSELEIKLGKLDAIHREVERLRSKQDTKSQVLSLDSEIRILNARLLDFEDQQCSKQRLLTKKSGSTALLKEARFRKQMKSKFVTKLGQLASLLRSWEEEEGHSFNASLLSDDVQMLLNEPDNMKSWIERRTKLMPSRTVPTTTPLKRSIGEGVNQPDSQNSSNPGSRLEPGMTPPRKKLASSSRQNQAKAQTSAKPSANVPRAKRSPTRKRKPLTISAPSDNVLQKRDEAPEVKSPVKTRAAKQRRKESGALPPFGRILSEISSPEPQGGMS